MIPDDVIFVVGMSGGIDSQAAARWIRNRVGEERVVLLNSNAGGNEHQITTKFLRDYSASVHPVVTVQPIVADAFHHDASTPIADQMARNRAAAERKGLDPDAPLTFDGLAAIKKRFPSRQAQFCTSTLKLAPAMRWCLENIKGRYVRVTGVRRDESLNRMNRPPFEDDPWFQCPVHHVVCDWTKQMCFDYVRAHGEPVNELYSLGFTRVGCAPCVNSGRADIRRWAKRFPEVVEKVRAWEKANGTTFFPPMIPGLKDGQYNWIDQVVEWANCDRGGKQYSLEIVTPAPACESAFGLCE